MYLARSFLKNVSVTTPEPIAIAGEMKKAQNARQTAIEVYVFAKAHPTLKSRATIVLMSQTGLRP